ncbi:MAG: GMC family oxidoreductase [Acidimicrobiia bacterium]|nr:GMC family oxidoreductase [Acidimicrobiia bacterium]
MTRTLSTEVLIIGSGAGGAVTAARLAEAGRSVLVAEEGSWYDPDAHEPSSLDEFTARYRHQGACAALGSPGVAFAEGRCVGGSTEINMGLYHRLPERFVDQWRTTYSIAEFDSATLRRYADEVEAIVKVSRLPGAPPESSAVLSRGADALGWRSVEFDRVYSYDESGHGTKQSMSRTMIPRAVAAGAVVQADCTVRSLIRKGRRVTGARATLRYPDGSTEPVVVQAEDVFVCGGAIQSPALLQRSGFRHNIGPGLKFHPTVKVAARFDHPYDHEEVPVQRVTEFDPYLTIGGSASRRGHVALALVDSAPGDLDRLLEHWQNVVVYYAAIRSSGSGRVLAIPGLQAPLVTYSLNDSDLSRLARGLVHLGEMLLAAGAQELFPSIAGGPIVRSRADLAQWWGALNRTQSNLMTVHLTSTIRMGDNSALTGADSFGRVWDSDNLFVNDASLLPDAPGVNPQAAVMTIAARNADAYLAR